LRGLSEFCGKDEKEFEELQEFEEREPGARIQELGGVGPSVQMGAKRFSSEAEAHDSL
jgi:hypothetical protein